MLVLGTNAILARVLAPADMGVYFLMSSLVAILAGIAQVGLGKAVVSLVPKQTARENQQQDGQLAMVAVIFGGCVSLLLAIAIAGGFGRWIAENILHSPRVGELSGVLAIWVWCAAMTGLIAETFRGIHDYRTATQMSGLLASGVTFVLLSATALIGSTSLESAVVTTVGGFLISALVGGSLWWRQFRARITEGCALIRTLVRTAWPMFVTGVGLLVISQVDIWILNAFRPHAEVAEYGAAARLITFSMTPLVIVYAVLPPMIAEMYARKRMRQLERLLRTISAVAGIPGILMVACYLVFGKEIMAAVYGDYYQQSAGVVAILATGCIVVLLSGTASATLMMTGHQVLMMAITAMACALSVVLCLVLVEEYGALGVATGMAVGTTVQHGAMFVVTRYKVGIWTHIGVLQMRHLREAARMISVDKAGQI
jgi:O-antigen/teichoic acid export membrane protein